MEEQNNNIIKEYDIIRVLATLLVVLGHSSYYSIITKYGNADYSTFIIKYGIQDTIIYKMFQVITEIIYSFHMTLFFTLSGALFYEGFIKGKYTNSINFIKKKFKKLIIPFFLVNIFYTIPIKLKQT